MAHTSIAYIDESGDDGMNGRYKAVGQRGGSSHWLTLSASVWRYGRDLDAVDWVKEIIARFPNAHQLKVLHCQNLDHRQRVAASQVLADKPFRTLCVAAHKPSLDPLVFTDKISFISIFAAIFLSASLGFVEIAAARLKKGTAGSKSYSLDAESYPTTILRNILSG